MARKSPWETLAESEMAAAAKSARAGQYENRSANSAIPLQSTERELVQKAIDALTELVDTPSMSIEIKNMITRLDRRIVELDKKDK